VTHFGVGPTPTKRREGIDIMQRLFVDFNTMMSEPVDLVKLGVEGINALPVLHEGEQVVLTDGEMEVRATILFLPERRYWMARPDWSTRVDLAAASAE
jgi:hypothetical protein